MENRLVLDRKEVEREGEISKGDQLYSDGWKQDFWWKVHYCVFKSEIIMLYT